MSTYSTNLAIELITTGTQAGVWGATTNTNLGTLVEQAISGYTTYAVTGGTDTLVMTQGASATARNMFIELTGTGGGNLAVPTNKKLYFIYNNTGGGLAVTVKTPSGTGISVPDGAKALLVCNGTNVVNAVNHLSNLTLANALPAASGGTGVTSLGAGIPTFLTTPSSANLATAVSDETGSGSLVFATGPTLVAPNLGTPASGTLTNCTFPTLNQNTTGTSGGISVSGGWAVTPSGTKLYFSYNGTNVGSLDSSGNLIALGDITAYGTP